MNKIRKGDEIIVIAGKDKGKRGKVSLRSDDSHLVVEGINLVKKHAKPNPMKGINRRHHRKNHADSPIQCRHFQWRHWQG